MLIPEKVGIKITAFTTSLMPNPLDSITKLLEELGLKFRVEDYEGEKIIIVELSENFGVYISILCADDECDIEYAVGDDNFTIRPESINLLRKAVDIIAKVNERVHPQSTSSPPNG